MTYLAAEAVITASGIGLASLCLDTFLTPNLVRCGHDVALGLTDSLTQLCSGKSIEWECVGDAELRDLCAEWTARRDVRTTLAALLRPLVPQLTARCADLAEQRTLGQVKSADTAPFWNEWSQAFCSRDARLGSLVHYMPWLRLTKSELGHVLDRTFASFERPEDEWLVIFTVRGLDSDGTIWMAGGFTFYDPTVFEFGEHGALTYRPEDQADGAATGAKITLRAETPVAAREAARQRLAVTLNVLSFAYSVGPSAPGARFDIDTRVYVANVAAGTWSSGGTVERATLVERRTTANEQLTRIVDSYGPFLAAADPSSSLDELRSGFLRALHWYRKGRWESDPGERFVFYWIGLEHLFARDAAKSRLPEVLPVLHVTWRNVKGLYWLHATQDAVIRQVESDGALRASVDAAERLKGWQDDRRILLQVAAAEELATIAERLEAASAEYIRKYATDLAAFASDTSWLVDQVQYLRDRCRFRLHLLYDLRNQIVHEALPYRADIELYAEQLEEIFEDVLLKMAGEAVSPQSNCASLDDLITAYRAPFL